jgi:hypothetical protein
LNWRGFPSVQWCVCRRSISFIGPLDIRHAQIRFKLRVCGYVGGSIDLLLKLRQTETRIATLPGFDNQHTKRAPLGAIINRNTCRNPCLTAKWPHSITRGEGLNRGLGAGWYELPSSGELHDCAHDSRCPDTHRYFSVVLPRDARRSKRGHDGMALASADFSSGVDGAVLEHVEAADVPAGRRVRRRCTSSRSCRRSTVKFSGFDPIGSDGPLDVFRSDGR